MSFAPSRNLILRRREAASKDGPQARLQDAGAGSGALCQPESRPVFPNRPALWTYHLFEPFLEWVNETLAKAKWLGLYERRGYATWAKLLPDDPPSPTLPDDGRLLNSAEGTEDCSAPETPEYPPIFLPCREATS